MFCQNCGKQIPDNTNFCQYCGAKITQSTPPVRNLPEGIEYRQGMYCWFYEVNLWKNGVFLFTIIKLLSLVYLGAFLLLAVINAFTGNWTAILPMGGMMLLVLALILVLTLLVYAGIAAFHHGKYPVFFVMDEESIVHAVEKNHAERGRKLSIALSVMSMDLYPIAAQMLSEKFVSQFRDVKKIKLEPARDLIWVKDGLVKNMVFAYPHQYKFVADYLMQKCSAAQIESGHCSRN